MIVFSKLKFAILILLFMSLAVAQKSKLEWRYHLQSKLELLVLKLELIFKTSLSIRGHLSSDSLLPALSAQWVLALPLLPALLPTRNQLSD